MGRPRPKCMGWGLTGLSENSFSTMAWRLGIRGEKMKMSYGKKREIMGFCFS